MARSQLIRCDFEDEHCCTVCKQISSEIFYLAMEGVTVCSKHGGHKQQDSKNVKAANMYRLSIWQKRLNEFTGSDQIKNLRDEIGILRIVMEETLNKCQGRDDLLMFSSRIAALATDISRLVTSCDRLEKNMGEMMDRPTAIKFASKLIDIVGRYVEDPDILDDVSCEILEELRSC